MASSGVNNVTVRSQRPLLFNRLVGLGDRVQMNYAELKELGAFDYLVWMTVFPPWRMSWLAVVPAIVKCR